MFSAIGVTCESRWRVEVERGAAKRNAPATQYVRRGIGSVSWLMGLYFTAFVWGDEALSFLVYARVTIFVMCMRGYTSRSGVSSKNVDAV